MVVGGYQESRCSGGRVIYCLADPGVDILHDGADDVARGAELAQFTGLADLFEDMLEQIAFGVGISLIKTQLVHQPSPPASIPSDHLCRVAHRP